MVLFLHTFDCDNRHGAHVHGAQASSLSRCIRASLRSTWTYKTLYRSTQQPDKIRSKEALQPYAHASERCCKYAIVSHIEPQFSAGENSKFKFMGKLLDITWRLGD